MSQQQVTPLDPDSPEGRRVAAELSEVLANARIAIEERRREASLAADRMERAA